MESWGWWQWLLFYYVGVPVCVDVLLLLPSLLIVWMRWRSE